MIELCQQLSSSPVWKYIQPYSMPSMSYNVIYIYITIHRKWLVLPRCIQYSIIIILLFLHCNSTWGVCEHVRIISGPNICAQLLLPSLSLSEVMEQGSCSSLLLHRLSPVFCTSYCSVLRRHCLGLPLWDLRSTSAHTERSRAACAGGVIDDLRQWPKRCRTHYILF